MDITVQREALLKPLQAVSGVVEKKQTLPILSNVLLSIQNGNLLLTGTDLEVELIGFVKIDVVHAEGSTTVSARKLFDICRALPENSVVRLTLEKNSLSVRTGESSFVLNTLSPQDFPGLEESTYPVQFSLKQIHLRNLLTKTYFAMGLQDVRHYLNGALLDISRNCIKCVAADGHRLALAVYNEPIGDVEARVILPRKSVLELIRLLGNENEQDLSIQIGDNRIKVTLSDFNFTSKLINAQYPDYNRLIPRGDTVVVGEREAIKHALTRASILSNEKFRGVRFQLEDSKLVVSANNSDQEQAEDAVSLEYSGEKIEIGFNVAYLLDVMSAITDKMVRFAFSDANNGVLIESAEGDLSQNIYVVMPMRL